MFFKKKQRRQYNIIFGDGSSRIVNGHYMTPLGELMTITEKHEYGGVSVVYAVPMERVKEIFMMGWVD